MASLRQRTLRRYEIILALAREQGYITNLQARVIGNWKQGYHHLRRLEQRGLLTHAAYNRWTLPQRRRWKCPACGLIPQSYSDCDCLT